MEKGKTFKSFGEMGRAGHGGPREGPPPRATPVANLPAGYLADGYADSKGNFLREIFIEWPKQLHQALGAASPRATKNSLRAFYSMLRMAKVQFDAQRRDKERALADAKNQLYKLRTAAEYQSTRRVISQLCHNFLVTNVDTVLNKGNNFEDFSRNFNGFIEHFQAVIAYLPERGER